MGTQLTNQHGGKSSLERRLSGALKPITPRREFVHGLGSRIQSTRRATFVNHVANWHVLAALVAGFVSLAVFLAMLMRALLNSTRRKHAA